MKLPSWVPDWFAQLEPCLLPNTSASSPCQQGMQNKDSEADVEEPNINTDAMDSVVRDMRPRFSVSKPRMSPRSHILRH